MELNVSEILLEYIGKSHKVNVITRQRDSEGRKCLNDTNSVARIEPLKSMGFFLEVITQSHKILVNWM